MGCPNLCKLHATPSALVKIKFFEFLGATDFTPTFNGRYVMTCEIKINSVNGVGTPLTKVVVSGIAQDCPDSFEGGNLTVTLSCRSSEDPDPMSQTVSVLSTGLWVAEFDAPLPNCNCGGDVWVTAKCLTGEMCAAPPFDGKIGCDDCPEVFVDQDDDIDTSLVITCDMDGSALVKIEYKWINTSQEILAARVNPGPGGTTVTGSMPFTFPTDPNWVHGWAILRYDPQTTPNPTPFFEFVRLDLSVLACPPILIDVATLPECEVGICPTVAVIEVCDSAGDTVQVDGNNAVLCLLPGDYTLKVVSPIAQPGVEFYWSDDDGLISPVISQQEITVQVAEGSIEPYYVSVTVPGCPPPSDGVELKGCVINCETGLFLELRNLSGMAVPTSSCVPPGDYLVHAVGPIEPPWDFKWTENGVQSNVETSAAYPLTVVSGSGHAVEVEINAPGCENKTAGLTFSGCDAMKPDPVSPLCGVLTYAIGVAFGLALIITLLALALQFCTNVPVPTFVWYLVGAAWAVVLILIGLSYFLCKFIEICPCLSKCDWLTIAWMGLLIGGIFALYLEGCCKAWMLAVAIGMLLSALVSFIMWIAECKPSKCLIIALLLLVFGTIVGSAFSFTQISVLKVLFECANDWVRLSAIAIAGGLIILNLFCIPKAVADDDIVAQP